MGFSITDDIGPFGGLLLGVMLLAAGIVLLWLFALARRARREDTEADGDHTGPIV